VPGELVPLIFAVARLDRQRLLLLRVVFDSVVHGHLRQPGKMLVLTNHTVLPTSIYSPPDRIGSYRSPFFYYDQSNNNQSFHQSINQSVNQSNQSINPSIFDQKLSSWSKMMIIIKNAVTVTLFGTVVIMSRLLK